LLAEKLNKEHGWEIMIHIDGASGAFIAPFQYPDLLWRAPGRPRRTHSAPRWPLA